jgi:hypothetical protein
LIVPSSISPRSSNIMRMKEVIQEVCDFSQPCLSHKAQFDQTRER